MRKSNRCLITALLALTALVVMTGTAKAPINPNFTVLHLVEQSQTILVLKLSKADAKRRIHAEVVEVLKGKKPATGKVIIDLSTASQKAWADMVEKIAATRGDAPVPFFVGQYVEEDQVAEGEDMDEAIKNAPKIARLQIDRVWVELDRDKSGVWNMSTVDAKMNGAWDGGSDMLIKAVRYIKPRPDDAMMPVEVGCKWAQTKRLGKATGRVGAALAVDLDGKGVFALFVAAEGGDRLYQWDADKADFEAARLASKSRQAVWADFNGDGRADLVSWDGAALSLWFQGADRTFTAEKLAVKITGDCLGLAVVDAGVEGRPGILVSTTGAPLLLTPGKDGAFNAKKLPTGSASLAKLGLASACLAADFDGDGLYDVLQPFEKGGLLYKGTGFAGFAAFSPAKPVTVSTGKGRAATCIGDYDMDGLLDVFMTGKSSLSLWSNRGKLQFVEVFGLSGEMCYTARLGGVSTQTCDINNDGLQDIAIFYGKDVPEPQPVHIYFNRGYRSFGKALSLVWMNQGFKTDTEDGQQAGVVADLNGDGAQDLAAILLDGTIMVYLRESNKDDPPLHVRAVLPAGSPYSGPVTVTAWNTRRCLGAWNVATGSTGASFGQDSPGEITLKWTFPGGKQQAAVIELVEGRVTLALGRDNGDASSTTPGTAPGKGIEVAPEDPAKPKKTSAAVVPWGWGWVCAAAALLVVIVLVLLCKKRGKKD